MFRAPAAGTLSLRPGEAAEAGLVAKAWHHARNVHDRTWRRRTARLLDARRPDVVHTNNLVGLTTAVWRAAAEELTAHLSPSDRARIFGEKSVGMDDPGMLAMNRIVKAAVGS